MVQLRSPQQVQAQVADFSAAVSSSSVTISQGGVSTPVNFSIVPRNGFSGSVQVSFTSLPVGVSSNPASPFTATSGVETAVNFGADATASTGSFTLSAQAVSGALSHSVSLTLAIHSLLGAPLLQGSSGGEHVVLAFANNSSAKLATWDASSPGQFIVSTTKIPVQDIATTVDGTAFAVQTATATEIRNSGMYVTAVPAAAELNQVPGRVAVPGLAMHPTGALIYQPFLTGAAGAANVKGGVDISDARSGELRMRIILPQQLMTDVDVLHGDFLTIDENGQRLFAITSQDGSPQNAALTVVQLASVPLAIGNVSSPTVSVAGGTSLTIRGSGFQSGIKLGIGGKPAMVTLVDMNTLNVVSSAVTAGPQQITLTNANGETVSLDAAVSAN